MARDRNKTFGALCRDPRYFQLAVLSGLLLYGLTALDFGVSAAHVAVLLASVLTTQWACTVWKRLPRFEARSALVSGLSLCLLLRTDSLLLAALAAVLTVGSKFVLRWNGRHIFNPSALGLVIMVSLSDGAWVSPGQWGSVAFFGFLVACVGGMVVHRALRSDVTFAFLLFYAAILLGRSWWLNEPVAIPLHRVQNGALLLFAFFMISDPKTNPDSRAGRLLFAGLVALGASYVHFALFRNNGLLFSLVIMSMATPLINRLLPGEKYEWEQTVAAGGDRGVTGETPPASPLRRRASAAG